MFALAVDHFGARCGCIGSYFGDLAVLEYHGSILDHLSVAHMNGGVGEGDGLFLCRCGRDGLLGEGAGDDRDTGYYQEYLFHINAFFRLVVFIRFVGMDGE